jgi:hypothetical protein
MHEENWFWVSNMEISKSSQKLHFRATSNGHKKKKQKNEKPKRT